MYLSLCVAFWYLGFRSNKLLGGGLGGELWALNSRHGRRTRCDGEGAGCDAITHTHTRVWVCARAWWRPRTRANSLYLSLPLCRSLCWIALHAVVHTKQLLRVLLVLCIVWMVYSFFCCSKRVIHSIVWLFCEEINTFWGYTRDLPDMMLQFSASR